MQKWDRYRYSRFRPKRHDFARAARVVELRFFGGLQENEIAEALGVSLITVKRDWKVARAWLMSRLQLK